MRYRDKLLPEPACAFIRHAFGCFYDAFLQIDLANKPFIPTLVFHETLLSFRSAVLRYAYTIRLLYIKRRFISKKLRTPPEEARKRVAADHSPPIRPRHHQRIQRTRLHIQTHHGLPESTRRPEIAAVTLHYAHPPAPLATIPQHTKTSLPTPHQYKLVTKTPNETKPPPYRGGSRDTHGTHTVVASVVSE